MNGLHRPLRPELGRFGSDCVGLMQPDKAGLPAQTATEDVIFEFVEKHWLHLDKRRQQSFPSVTFSRKANIRPMPHERRELINVV